MPTIYYEAGLPATLIPVRFVGWAKSPAHDVTGCLNAVVQLKRTHQGAYQCGEILHVPAGSVVQKAGRRNYFQLVRPATLPAVDPANLLPARI